MNYTAVIRQRGQLTIPDQVREMLVWLRPGSVVGLEIDEEEIKIKPYTKSKAKGYDWDKIWAGIRLCRSFKGKRGNLSKFIAEDRYRH